MLYFISRRARAFDALCCAVAIALATPLALLADEPNVPTPAQAEDHSAPVEPATSPDGAASSDWLDSAEPSENESEAVVSDDASAEAAPDVAEPEAETEGSSIHLNGPAQDLTTDAAPVAIEPAQAPITEPTDSATPDAQPSDNSDTAVDAAGAEEEFVPRSMALPAGVTHQVTGTHGDRLEMMVNSSKILTLETPIPTAQVNNTDLLDLTPLSPNQIQAFAKKPGVTTVNLWDKEGKVYSIDVFIYPDARELQILLRSQFPNASLKVVPLTNSVVISGFVDEPAQVQRIIQIAQDYHPNVINNITVGGVQQVLLHVKVMEVSRTKLRDVGFDFGNFNGDDLVISGISGLLNTVTPEGATGPGVTVSNPGTMSFAVMNGSNAFFGMLQLLVQNQIAKIMAEPTLITVSGRPAYFNVGGEIPVPASGLGAANVQFRPFGTQVDFVPIVLGNGRLRLEVRPRVSEVDPSLSVAGIPGFRVRVVDTGVEMNAGETLALAGLVQTRVDTQQRGIPWVSELPYVGAAFRRNTERVNEVELLIMVTPQLVAGMACEEVPPGGPGVNTTTPTDWQFYMKGHIEVPGHVYGGNHKTPKKQGVWAEPAPGYINGCNDECTVHEAPGESLPQGTPMPAQPASQRTARGPVRSVQPAPRGPAGPRSESRGSVNPAPPRGPQPVVVPAAARATGTNGTRGVRTAAQPGLLGPTGYDVRK